MEQTDAEKLHYMPAKHENYFREVLLDFADLFPTSSVRICKGSAITGEHEVKYYDQPIVVCIIAKLICNCE